MTVETNEFTWEKLGLLILSLSTAILFKAWLSSTTTESALFTNLFNVSTELYGCTTTSDVSAWFGNTEYVDITFLLYLSFNLSNKKLPNPLPVPPAIECNIKNPSKDYEPSAYLSIISIIYSWNFWPWEYPLAQLLPAPPPYLEINMFYGLYNLAWELCCIELTT